MKAWGSIRHSEKRVESVEMCRIVSNGLSKIIES
jgi:hypothetical protein